MRSLLVFITVLLLSACGSAESVLLVTTETGDASHVPLPGVTIHAMRGSHEVVSITGADGRARLRLSPGRWNIRAELAGIATPPATAIRLRGEEAAAVRIPIRMSPEGAMVLTSTCPTVEPK